MKIVIENANDLCEVENLIMMAERHHRYYGEYAAKGLAALRTARKEYLSRANETSEFLDRSRD